MGFQNLKSQNDYNGSEKNKSIKQELFNNSENLNPFSFEKATSPYYKRGISDYGNAPNINWKEQFGGSGTDAINAVVSDDNGYIYVTGNFSGQMSLSGNTYVSTGTREAFVAKFSNDGNLIWLSQIPATENNTTYSKDICIDASGLLYITGYYTGTIGIGESNLPDLNDYSMFYAKLNTAGELINGSYHSEDINEIGFSIDVDSNGCVYISSSRSNRIDSRHTSWLLKYDQSNNLVSEVPFDVGFNNIVISGNDIFYSGVIEAGHDGYLDENVTLIAHKRNYDVFIAKSNLVGEFEWGIVASHYDDYIGGSYKDKIIIDNLDNIYMVGSYWEGLTFGNETISNSDFSDGFIAKFNSQGNSLWLKSYYAMDVTLSADLNGNAYITSETNTDDVSLYKYNTDGDLVSEEELENYPRAIFINNDNKIITAGSHEELIYLSQYDIDVNIEWTNQFEGNSAQAWAIGMVSDTSGNIYTFNYTSNTIDYFGATVNKGIFISKQNGNGNILWLKQFPDVKVDYNVGNYITIDPANENIYITGAFNTDLIIPDGPTLTPSELGSTFIIKYGLNGAYKWSIQEDFIGDRYCLAADYDDNILLSGTFNNQISMSGIDLVSAGLRDCFIAKYNMDAQIQWAKRAGGESEEYIGLISVDGNNNVFLTGDFFSKNVTIDETQYAMLVGNGNILFSKLNKNGDVLWIKSFAASQHSYYDNYSRPTGIITDIEGYTYLKGNSGLIAYFDDILLENAASGFNKFITKIDNDGNVLWANSITQPQRNHQFDYNQFDIDNEGSVYFGVQARDTLVFGDDFQYYPTSANDLFVAKYSTDGSLTWVKTMQGNDISYSRVKSVAVYKTNNVFVNGYFRNYLSIDNEELSSTDGHGYIAMFGDDMSSIKEIYNGIKVEIYPNPANDQISISTKISLIDSRINIYSASGKLVKSDIINKHNKIDVSKLPKGAYFTELYTEKGILVGKFIKN